MVRPFGDVTYTRAEKMDVYTGRRVLLARSPVPDADFVARRPAELARIAAETGAAVVLVTHSIPEAAFLSDRVVVMGGRPSTIMLDMKMPFARPRRFEIEETQEFTQVCRQLRLTIEAAHGHGQDSAKTAAKDSTKTSAAGVIE